MLFAAMPEAAIDQHDEASTAEYNEAFSPGTGPCGCWGRCVVGERRVLT